MIEKLVPPEMVEEAFRVERISHNRSYQAQHDALSDLRHAYVILQAWGTPHFAELDTDEQEWFRQMLAAGLIGPRVEELKHALIVSGFGTPGHWLTPIFFRMTGLDANPISDNDRDYLANVVTLMTRYQTELAGLIALPDEGELKSIAGGPMDDLEFSKAMPPKEWCRIFDMSWDALKPKFDSQKIRNKPLSIKSYQVCVKDIPAHHQANFKAK